MTSILTNRSALIALQTMRMVNQQLDATGNRVSTGQRISSAADGAAYWAIASTLKADNGSLGALEDAISLDRNSVDAAAVGLTKVIDQLRTISNALVSAASANTDRGKLQNDIEVAQVAIRNYSDNTVMNGSNWLSIDSSKPGFSFDMDLVSAFSRKNGSVSVSTTTLSIGSFFLYDANPANTSNADLAQGWANVVAAVNRDTSASLAIAVSLGGGDRGGFMDTAYYIGAGSDTMSVATLDMESLTSSDADQRKLLTYLKIVDATTQQLLTGASKLGSMSTLLKAQQEFTRQLMDINTSSIGSLVDADVEEESTRLKALQTQQQLGIQSLSIANASSQNVMSLFR
ncbi:hypothetical protein BHAOGJBA_1336 [Methylobacterium hispanicum]|uniref:Flagellin n=1 Tax=Methylobacterium hispanicum TaxID=270350 RepID=A0AAV4ZHB4_9HYPH|nr:flagellin [Methylobacterium hispanicum]GJD87831.1 hypothetical protein BHAOGJBA_1336 [Methylobacterium hispanicum]